jgi:hypothetical protein
VKPLPLHVLPPPLQKEEAVREEKALQPEEAME